MAHEEKSKFLTIHTKIAHHIVRNVVGFLLLERFISNTENDVIPCGPAIRENAAILDAT